MSVLQLIASACSHGQVVQRLRAVMAGRPDRRGFRLWKAKRAANS